MKTALIGALTAGVLLAGCGSAASTPAPVESSPSGGEVAASVPDCPEGAPARDGFRTDIDESDGVVGTIYNDTSEALGVTPWWRAICRLGPGRSVVFAGGTEVEEQDGGDSPAQPAYFTITRLGDTTVKTKVELDDPNVGWPRGAVTVSSCETVFTRGLSEGQAWERDSRELGHVTIARLDDDADAARRWSGSDSWWVDDWARIDVRVLRVGTGC
jgi:hypothetical protein